jgi:hypothetical protein
VRIRVFIDGREIDDDGLIVGTRGVTLWFRVDPGYDADPPEGTFSIGQSRASGPFASLRVEPGRRGNRYDVQFVSPSPADPAQPAVAEAPAPRIQLSRRLTFIPAVECWILCLTFILAASLVLVFSWKTGIVLHHGESKVDSLWSGTEIVPTVVSLSTVLLGTVGVTRRSSRSWFLSHFWPSEVGLLVVLVLVVSIPLLFYGVATNAAPEKARPLSKFGTELAPGKTMLYFAPPGHRSDVRYDPPPPFEACALADDCAATDASLTFLALSTLSAGTTVTRCARPSVATCFKEELAAATTCALDPAMRISRPESKLPRSDVECSPAPVAGGASAAGKATREVTYELRPFAPRLVKRFATLRDVSTTVVWPKDASGGYSELVLEGLDLIGKVRFPLPSTEALVAAGPWIAQQAGLLNGAVLSGTESVGKLACALVKDTTELRIEFTASGAHIARLVVERLESDDTVSNGRFAQRFDVDRPELVTHVPWCGKDDSRYAIDLYLDEAWTPEGWKLELPMTVASVRVHGADGSYEGSWRARNPGGSRSGTLVSRSIPARIRTWRTQEYEWEAHQQPDTPRAVVWAFKEDDEFSVQLWDGSRKKALEKNKFQLENLALRACNISSKDNTEQLQSDNCGEKGSARAWLKQYPHFECSAESRLCTPP